MIYKPGHRYTLRRQAIRQLLAGNNLLAREHDQQLDQGYGWPRISVSVAVSGLATIRATWRKNAGTAKATHRLVLSSVRLA